MSEKHERLLYPFSAIVGQNLMKEALLLNAINPSIGGVLIKGEKGTAKSTSVRSLASLLPEQEFVVGCEYGCAPDDRASMCQRCRSSDRLDVMKRRMTVVELPVSATEDKVVGTLDISEAIKHGEKKFEPGILAEAHRNILYVDEVNLLNDHIVDVLLDAAAMGVNVIEREGISYAHPSRFILIGTMNPEEGDLRPQLLDRFGLCVNVTGIADPDTRMEVVKRRMEFEKDPNRFVRKWKKADDAIARRIVSAKRLLPKVVVPEDLTRMIIDICIELGVDGHRGDINMMKTSATIAAYEGRRTVTEDDVREAAKLVLSHRIKRLPFDDDTGSEDRIDEAVENAGQKHNEREMEGDPPDGGGPDGSGSTQMGASDPFA